MMSGRPLPTRTLAERPDLDQLKRQAKELLEAFRAGTAGAVAEVAAHYHDANAATFALHDAQLVLARAYGFESWPKLKACVDGASVVRLRDAIVADDVGEVRAILQVRPELARSSRELQMLHYAVFNRSPGMVRLLMRHGAPARHGVYPHRDATTPLAIAFARDYRDIVAVIEEEEQRLARKTGSIVEAPGTGMTPLHSAARRLDVAQVAALLQAGADPQARDMHDHVPLDWAAYSSTPESVDRFREIARLLRARDGAITASAAVVLGDIPWLRARHADGTLTNPIEDAGGLLRIAVTHDRNDVLALLLEFGFDPDERLRLDIGDPDVPTFTWGMPLAQCAGARKHEMAQLLLERGADANASLYASGNPIFWAYGEGDVKMVKLLEQHGGVPTAATAALFRQTDLARKMLAGEAPYRLERDATLPEELLWGAACGGDPDIVRMAVERVDWPRADPRWFEMLEQPLRLWAHGSVARGWDPTTYLKCFRALLQHCDPNIRGRNPALGLTILHSIAGSREHLTADDRVRFATAALDAGGRLDLRDNLLKSTPLAWACRWGRLELVELFLERGADSVEADAEEWATPEAWAKKMNRGDVLESLRRISEPPASA
jgi:ankyrin repeat protein